MTTTHGAAAARRVTYQLETLWDYDYVPTHDELATLYETAKKNQWNGSVAIDWDRPVGAEGPVLNVQMAFMGTDFFPKLTAEERKEVEIRVSAWRLSQFLHGEQGALVVCGQLVNSIPELDAKLYASTQVVDEGRHVEVFERYVKKLHKIYPVDPLLKALLDEILATNLWELKLLGMQMIVEGLAIAAFNLMRKQTGDPTLGAAARLRPAGRRASRELRVLRAAAVDPEHGAGQARVPRGLHLQGVRPHVRARRADGLSVGEERLERDGLGR